MNHESSEPVTSPFTTLRDYQERQLDAIEQAYVSGIRQQVVSAATGTGKTITFAQIPGRMRKHLPGQMLVLAHREDLLDKWEVTATIIDHVGEYRQTFSDAEAAFRNADALIHEIAPDAVGALKRVAGWQHKPATDAQVRLLRQLLNGRPIPADLDRGAASRAISSIFAGRR
jgi:hypothetical protein